MSDVTLPDISDEQIADDLVWLTEQLVTVHGAETTGGVLGGEYGYGAWWDNDVFEMNPYYWGECVCGHEAAETHWYETHEHADICYQQVILARGFLDFDSPVPFEQREQINRPIIRAVCAEMGLDPDFGALVHCTCTYNADLAAWQAANPHDPSCGIVKPNFLHKPTGTRIDFYKYIGRGMECDVRGDWRTILAECVRSLTGNTPTST